ncbi:MAG TPA: methionine ABC transporter ATP-binding protein [Ramlibacter sp.]|jgi:D-methionine transport system ATP-binding protein|uniref:methionine ABC transporter ATP-binding protein n=1 Tax=Ramlibacter sp. TaxID=1917967 RepID=UPI002D3CADFC|nr:methionine ABC transporter ATP-binding protein [Ramlibacter sp.]HZY17859.1 methionine ABC transporter ATP-binding protein [Ramlibacter sp.]
MIELQGIVQSYGAVQALRGIDLAIAPGEVFGVIGKSGAGKSSLVRTINLLNRPTAGRVLVAGRDLTALAGRELREARRQIGVVFQHFNLLSSRTVRGNVALPLELAGVPSGEIRRRVDDLLALVGLSELADRYPAQISGGQKQRVGIARALANRPKVLLSDEATSALDPETTRSILALLQQIRRDFGLTIVLITHQMQVIKQIADRVAVLDAGQVVEQGAVLDLFTHPRQAITRSLIEDVVPQQLPESVVARVRALMAADDGPAQLLRLAFAGDDLGRPLLSDVIRRFGLDLNILHGQVDEVQGRPFGSLAVLARGAREQLAAATAALRDAGVRVQELPHA